MNDQNKIWAEHLAAKIAETRETIIYFASADCTATANTKSTQTYQLTKQLKTLTCLLAAIQGKDLDADMMTTVTRLKNGAEHVVVDIKPNDDILEYIMSHPNVSMAKIDTYIKAKGWKREGSKIVEA
jgi:hypothetical protein